LARCEGGSARVLGGGVEGPDTTGNHAAGSAECSTPPSHTSRLWPEARGPSSKVAPAERRRQRLRLLFFCVCVIWGGMVWFDSTPRRRRPPRGERGDVKRAGVMMMELSLSLTTRDQTRTHANARHAQQHRTSAGRASSKPTPSDAIAPPNARLPSRLTTAKHSSSPCCCCCCSVC
jgi:hypothetical protein